MIYKAVRYPETQNNIAEVAISTDSIPAIKNDSITSDIIRVIPNVINREELIAQEIIPPNNLKIQIGHCRWLTQVVLNKMT